MQAGFWIRLGAILLDTLIIGLPLIFLSYILTGGASGDHYITRLISFLYSLLLPVLWGGYTIGKKLCGIRIAKLDGTPPTIWTMLLRQVVSGLFYGLTLGIGVIISAIMVGVREDRRAIHDFIAGTEVVYDE